MHNMKKTKTNKKFKKQKMIENNLKIILKPKSVF